MTYGTAHPVPGLTNIEQRHRNLPIRSVLGFAQIPLILQHSVLCQRVVVLHGSLETSFAHTINETLLQLRVTSVRFQFHARVFPFPLSGDVLPHGARGAEHFAHPDIAALLFRDGRRVQAVVDFVHALKVVVHQAWGVGGAEEVPVFPLWVAEGFGCDFVRLV